MRPYRISRYVLASSYLILGVLNCTKIFESSESINLDRIRAFTLIIASYQALLFTFSLLTLIQPFYVTFKRVSRQFGVISLVAILLLLLQFTVSGSLYTYFYYVTSVIYIFQLAYYTFLFRKKYAQCLKQLENYYNDDEGNRLRWVKVFFYMALSIGISALLSTYLPLFFSSFFVAAFIVFYILFAIKFCNYPSKFGYVVAAVTSADESLNDAASASALEMDEIQPAQSLSLKEQELQHALAKWIEEKRFQHEDISRDDIAASLGTDRYFLAFYFRNRMRTEFRVWRTRLRIEEAKQLLVEHPDLSISAIGQIVGMSDRSNFQKKFIEIVGISPKDWRKLNL
ncbi:AraC family transcriptional regulator [Dysgonomonas sp.]